MADLPQYSARVFELRCVYAGFFCNADLQKLQTTKWNDELLPQFPCRAQPQPGRSISK